MSTTTEKLIAYHGDQALKDRIMAQIQAHRKADEILQGAYYATDGKTRVCAVGCVLHDPNGGHIRYESEFGISAVLAHLEDGIFESLPLEDAKEWPARFMGAIQIGADLSSVWPRFAAWMMVDEEWGLASVAEAEDITAVCQRVGDAYARIAAGETVGDDEAASISRAARDAWAARDARDAFVKASAGKLIELLAGSDGNGRFPGRAVS